MSLLLAGPYIKDSSGRGCYMSAHELLNLSNKFRKRDKMQGYEFNKFNNTGARMLDSIYHLHLNYFEIAFLATTQCLWLRLEPPTQSISNKALYHRVTVLLLLWYTQIWMMKKTQAKIKTSRPDGYVSMGV